MATSQSPKIKSHAPYSSVSPQGKAGFHPHFVLTQPVTKHFQLRHTIPLRVSKSCRLLWHTYTLLLLGECRVSPHGSAIFGSPARMVTWQGHGSWFIATPSWKATPGLADWRRLPHPSAWEFCCCQAPTFFLWPWQSWDHTIPPTIPPCLATWEPFRHRDVPHWSRLLNVLILCSTIILLYHFPESQLMEALSPNLQFIFPYITSDSFLFTFYLAKSGLLFYL